MKKFFKNAKEKICAVKTAANRKLIALSCKVKETFINTLQDVKAEFYIDKTVGIIIAVVVGVLLMGIVYTFIKANVETELNSQIGDLWDYSGS